MDEPILPGVPHRFTRHLAQRPRDGQQQSQVAVGVIGQKGPVLIVEGITARPGHPVDHPVHIRRVQRPQKAAERLEKLHELVHIAAPAHIGQPPIGRRDEAQPLPVFVFERPQVEESAALDPLERLIELVEEQHQPVR